MGDLVEYKPRHTDAEYLKIDPFSGDRDVNIRCKTVKIVKTRKQQDCWHCGMRARPIQKRPGTRMYCERAVVDGEWQSSYTCLQCFDEWLDDSWEP